MKDGSYFVIIAYNKHRFIVADDLTYQNALAMAMAQLKQRTHKGRGAQPYAINSQVVGKEGPL